ncbi:nitrate reductase [Microbacterium esteraromaticum]|uniref:Nitrate reductase n=1 Tax=Microbacterium esteraromaticum TaxID=57043 RepID=A0A939DVV1_9MICO|nr:solute carrier family 23 protein [Microbacterium esteraromaticum]MBN8205003.1 nitrate reductase [Microbacterium esteraromaticum]MBN8415157.1 nitrate reductase [Microbacterium esteraromaticum]MBY6059963.1 nitrate reductase [Microbacterium esteraromaticum]MCA1307000.1 nitrate reductase [Microbacterium esteraromaticum]
MPLWKIHGNGRTVAPDAVVRPEERLNWPATIAIGVQHVVAMFGATFLVPILTGFPVPTTLLFSGIGTILFLLITRNKLPSYLGSSFAFIAPVTAATATAGTGSALAGIVAVGLLLAIIGVVVHIAGVKWVDRFLPPVLAGTIVALIGFNLAGAARGNYELAPITATFTLAVTILFAVVFRGFLGRISIFLGVIAGYIFAGFRGELDFTAVEKAAWLGFPTFEMPDFVNPNTWSAMAMFLPVVLVLIAENVGHVRGVATMVEDPAINKQTGKALIADGISTSLAGFFGGSGTTTYGENIGVMASTRVYSTAAYWVAGFTAILLSMSPKFGAVINSVPAGVLGGVTTALYGLIGVIGIKIWVDNKVDFSRPVNQYTAAVGLIVAVGGFQIIDPDSGFQLGGIVLATVGAILIYHLGNLIARLRKTGADDPKPLAAVGPLGGDPA